MDKKSVVLLKKILSALELGLLKDNDVNKKDIVDLIEHEIIVNKQCFSKEMYDVYFSEYMENVNDNSYDINSVIKYSIDFLLRLPTSYNGLLEKLRWKEKLGNNYNEEVEMVLGNIEKSGELRVFNYDFASKYSCADVDVFWDEENSHNYIIYKGKKMYFPSSWEVNMIVEYCRGIFCEQDEESPHYYNQKGFAPEEGDIVVDAGVAEGNFSLDIIDRVKHIYLIEPDEDWLDALKLTFEPYEEKVSFIRMYLSDTTSDTSICMDDICEEINYLKMDIEGFEKMAIEGGKRLLKNSRNIRVAICSYHCDGDEEYLSDALRNWGFEVCHSKGYMFPEWEPGALYECKLRRGLILGRKKCNH